MFRNKASFYGEHLAQPQTEVPPIVGGPGMLIHYIRIYPPY